jgi:nitrite reductase/ring-hydroxylating ferredoxin subunit
LSDGPVQEIAVCGLDELDDPGCKEFRIGEGDWPFRGFVVRLGEAVYAYQNFCMHAGHPLNWKADAFLTGDGSQIICASHAAVYEIESGECVAGPCPGKKLRPVDVKVRDGEVVVKGPTGPIANRG